MSELTGEESMAGHTKLMCEFGCVPKTIKSVGSWQGKVTVCNQCIEQLKVARKRHIAWREEKGYSVA